MEDINELALYFYIACGITLACLVTLFALVGILFCKIGKQSKNSRSDQLSQQTNMMSAFCYSNPEIVPGEELSRRGFSMYGSTFDEMRLGNKQNPGTYSESRSKF